MAGRFINPYPQFLNSTPTVLSGAKLFFYAAGTSTKQNTYTDRALTIANTNPVVLNSAGYPSTEIWLQDLDYKVVLAPSTDTDPPGSAIWTSDYVRARDSAIIAKTVTGSGAPNGSVAGTAGSASILPDFYWDFTNSILYVCTTTGTISTAVWTAINASTAASVVPAPQGYLTLTTATPIIASDVTAATAVYYTPFVGNLVPIYNGSSFVPTTFTEQTLSLVASHAASNIYDVFMFNNGGVPTLVTGPSWSAGTLGSVTAGSCARGTGAGGAALSRVNGIYTNAVQMTGRNGATTYTINANLATYLGSIFMDGTNGQVSCHRSYGQSRKWGVWNAFNRQDIVLKAGDSTASWVVGTTAFIAINSSTLNNASCFVGLAEPYIDAEYLQSTRSAVATGATYDEASAISVNAATAAAVRGTAIEMLDGNNTGTTMNMAHLLIAAYRAPAALGITILYMMQNNTGTTNITTFGAETSCSLKARYTG